MHYDDPKVINDNKWQITGGMNDPHGYFPKSNVRYISFISDDDTSCYKLCFDLRELLSDSQELGYLRMRPLPEEHSGMMDIITDMDMEYASHMSQQTSGGSSSSKFQRRYYGKATTHKDTSGRKGDIFSSFATENSETLGSRTKSQRHAHRRLDMP